MANFTYNVRSAQGTISSGTLTAESRIDALNSLRNQGMYVLELVEQDIDTPVHGAGFSGGFFQRVKLDEMALFTRQLSAMVGAGIAITRCLDTLSKQQTNQYFGRLLQSIKNDVASGLPLSAAMAKYPRVFNAMVISLILSAEETGTLDATLEQLAESFEAEVRLRHQISAGMRYPMIVSVAALLVVTFVMIFVIPQFKELFSSFGADLPTFTQVVIKLSDFVAAWWWAILAVVVIAVVVASNIWKRSPKFRETLDRILLKVPVLGAIMHKAALARFCRTTATMFAAGVPLVEALQSVAGATGSAVYEKAVLIMRDDVATGQSLQLAMRQQGLFPHMVIQMVTIGEESGALDDMLGKVADFYEEEVDNAVDALSSLLEPLIMVILGTLIGGLVVALYLPIFQLGSVVSGN